MTSSKGSLRPPSNSCPCSWPLPAITTTSPSRASSIARAIEEAEPGDVVVIAGKGHEQGQEFEGGRKEPFDDVTVARDALRSRRGVRA